MHILHTYANQPDMNLDRKEAVCVLVAQIARLPSQVSETSRFHTCVIVAKMAAEEPAPPAAPVPADPAKPQKKRSPNRLVVEEALNDDNSEPWLQMLCYSHQKQIWTKGDLC